MAGLRAEPSRARGRRVRELLDRDPAAERHRRAAHGPRAQQRRAGHADPPRASAGQAHEVDPRHRPRRDRHTDAGREGAGQPRHEPRGARSRAVRGPRLVLARALRQPDHRADQAPGLDRRLPGRALHARPRLCAGRAEGLRRRSTRRATSTATATWSTGIRAAARRSPTWRSRSARSPTRSTTSTTRWPRAAARSRSPRSARRRCSPTSLSR